MINDQTSSDDVQNAQSGRAEESVGRCPPKKKLRPLRISRADVNTHSSLETQSQHRQQLPPDSIGTVCWHRWHGWHRWHHCHCRISASSTVHLPQTTFYTCLAHDVQQSGSISISNLTGWPGDRVTGIRLQVLLSQSSHVPPGVAGLKPHQPCGAPLVVKSPTNPNHKRYI